jgi:hypothetical protein
VAEPPHDIDELLRPSLSPETTGSAAIYSPNALFLTAFFGGPFALIGIAALNASRLGRLRQDSGYLIAGILLTIGFVTIMYQPGFEWHMAGLSEAAGARTLSRALALLLALAAYLLHRRFYRSMAIVGLDAPSPWAAAIGCCLLGIGALAAAIILVRL